MSKFEYTTVTFARFPQMSFVDETVLSNYRTMAQEKFDTLTRERDELKAHLASAGDYIKILEASEQTLTARIEKLRSSLKEITELADNHNDITSRGRMVIAKEALAEDDRAQSGEP